MSDRIVKLAIAAGAVAGTKSLLDYLSQSDHDRVLRETAKALENKTANEATIRVDHDVGVGKGRPRKINSKRPDLTLSHFPSSTFLAVEVETAKSLNGHSKAQLEAFAQKDNYQSVLVVPEDTREKAEDFVSANVFADVVVTTPTDVLEDLF